MATADQDLRVSAEPLFSPEDPALRDDPYTLYRRLRETDPVHRSSLGFWVVSAYADVASIQHDPRCDRGLRPDDNVYTFWGGPDSPVSTEARRWMLLMNPPDHTRLRGLVRPAFRYRALTALRCQIQQLVDDLIDEVEEAGSMDVIADLAHPLPVTVIGDLLGLPIDDRRQCREWAEVIGRIFDPTPSQEALERAATAIHQASDYIREHVARRRRAPGDDLLSSLIAAEKQGDRLSDAELVSNVNLLLMAGHETTRNLIGNGLLALLRNPAQLVRLRADPSLVPNAVEELLRYDSPVQTNRRIALKDLELGGVRIRAGDRLLLLIGAAHRDPEQFTDPDALDVARANVRPLSFGGGAHFCIGAGLSRIEAEITLRTVITRLANLELVDERPRWRHNFALRGLEALYVSFSSR